MRMAAPVALFLTLLVTFAGVARADSIASELPIGSTYEDFVRVSRTRVPLPAGKWVVTALKEARNHNNNVTADVTLANFVNGRLMAYVAIRTNLDPERNGWVPSDFCPGKNAYFTQTDAAYQRQQACWGINHTIMNATSSFEPTYGKSIRQTLADRNLTMPRVMISAKFRAANEAFFLNYEILLNPEYFGFSAAGETSWANSPWHKDLVARDGRRQQFLEQVKAQYSAFLPVLAGQFR